MPVDQHLEGRFVPVGEESLQQLPVVERFRPNVVVDGELPFAEEGWTAVELGGVRYRVLEVCDRCVMTRVWQEPGDPGADPPGRRALGSTCPRGAQQR